MRATRVRVGPLRVPALDDCVDARIRHDGLDVGMPLEDHALLRREGRGKPGQRGAVDPFHPHVVSKHYVGDDAWGIAVSEEIAAENDDVPLR